MSKTPTITTSMKRRKGTANVGVVIAQEIYPERPVCGSAGALALTLSTAVDNESAQQLYRSNGWDLDKDYLTFEFSL